MLQCKVLSEPVLISKNSDIEELYLFYRRNIAEGLTFRNKPVFVFTELSNNLRQQTFEHLVTKNVGENKYSRNSVRLYDYDRASKLLWIRDILSNAECFECSDFRVFPECITRQGRKRFIVWCLRADYVIVLEEREISMALITAYELVYANAKRKLENKYSRYLQKTNSETKHPELSTLSATGR